MSRASTASPHFPRLPPPGPNSSPSTPHAVVFSLSLLLLPLLLLLQFLLLLFKAPGVQKFSEMPLPVGTGTSPGLALGLLLVLFALSGAVVDGIYLWPMPKSVRHGSNTLQLSKDFKLRTEGSSNIESSEILKDGFLRMVGIVLAPHVVNGPLGKPNSDVLAGLDVVVVSSDDTLNFGVDESYRLSIPSSGDQVYGRIEAKTVYGALHGFQTFSQLCHFNFTTRNVELHLAPWIIIDQPRFPYRGLLIDTSRHYQPVPVIKGVIDAMAYAKLNVLHWHIVDTQSFPLEIPSYPRLWDGAYSYSERYTMADAVDIVQGIGYPSLWPSSTCQQPLDVSNEFTFKVIDGILSDFSKVFKFNVLDDNASCKEMVTILQHPLTVLCFSGGVSLYFLCKLTIACTSDIHLLVGRLDKHGMNESEAYKYFVLRAQKIALSHGYEIVNWEETFNNFGNLLSPQTVVHNWLGGGVAPKVVAAGLRCIVSNQDNWYLDHLDATWQQFYMNEPLTNITNPEQQKLVLGGEVCMWERLWSPFDKLAKDPRQVTSRLAHFRCLLNQMGVAAAPLAGPGRVAPEEPGSCYKQ
ncbi:hypothetical protein Taro_008578 [Colocasia esculenta]|uniref:Beta-hexosaminidase n=1 Tax=Colocasia esculenta TaxID=4460 RepID=A0A843TXX4_COLES|nr:hypothetical protein [Colocasia esculenta]